MPTLSVQLPAEAYRRLDEEASQSGKPPEELAGEWLMERLTRPAESERHRVREILRQAGMLGELGPELSRLADPSVRPETVEAAIARAGGTPLSEIVIEQRGPKG